MSDERSNAETAYEDRAHFKAKRDIVVSRAAEEGLKTGIGASIGAGALVYLGHRFWPAFRKGLSISGKSALVVMAGLGMGTLRAELLIGRKEEWVEGQPTDAEIHQEKNKSAFVPHLRAANYVYFHPFQCIAGVGGTAIGYIFWQNRHTKLSFLQQILHTRVAGQASVLATLASIMFFREWMERNGGAFPIPGEEAQVEDIPVQSFGRFAKVDIQGQVQHDAKTHSHKDH